MEYCLGGRDDELLPSPDAGDDEVLRLEMDDLEDRLAEELRIGKL